MIALFFSIRRKKLWALLLAFTLMFSTLPAFALGGPMASSLYFTQAYNPNFLVKKVNLTGGLGGSTLYESATGTPHGIAIDAQNGFIYYSDPYSEVKTIFRAGLNGENPVPFIANTTAVDIAVDPVHNRIYYAQQSPNHNVMMANLADGSSQTPLYYSETGSPTSLAVDPAGGHLYFAVINENKIYRANLDGTNPTALITGTTADDIALDPAHNRIYYAQQYPYFNVMTANLADGSGQTQLYYSETGSPTSLAVDPAGGHLYFAVTNENTIYKANLDGTNRTAFLTGVPGVNKLALYLNTPPFMQVNAGLTVTEDEPAAVIGNGLLQVMDSEQAAATLTYTIGTATAKGLLKKDGAALSAGGTFTQADIDGGKITYTPNPGASGTDSFTFTVSDGSDGSVTGSFTITINPATPPGTAPAITTTSLPGGTVNAAYGPASLTATGDTPITWSIIDGSSLPDGLTLTGSTLSGTPLTSGTFSFTVKAENTAGDDTQALSIVIGPAPPFGTPPTIITTSLPGGTVGMAYSQTLAATGTAPITWSIVSSNPLLPILLSGNTISCMPLMSGTFSFTVKAENTAGSVTRELSIVISPVPVSAAISPDTGSFDRYSPGDVTTAITWNSAAAVTGVSDGTTSLASPAHYEVTGSGATATLTVKQAYLATQAVGSVALTVTFDQGDPATLTITVTDSTPPSISPASVNYDLSAPGDVSTNITWNSAQTVTGVVYNSAGLIFGPNYTVAADILIILDSYLSGLAPSEGDTLVFEITFDTGDTAALTVNVVNNYAPSNDANLSDLQVGGITVSGFAPNVTLYNVDLPYGMQPGSAAVSVSATANDPLAQVGVTQASALPGSATVTVTAEDTTTTKTYTINFTLEAAPGTAPAITTTSLPGGTVGKVYNQTLAATGSTPITWTIDSGSLPDGLTLSRGGVISGIPTARGTFDVTVKAENSADSDTKALLIVISAASTGGGGRGSGGSTPVTPIYMVPVSGISPEATNLIITVNTDAGNATVVPGVLTGDIFTGDKHTVITVPSIPGVNSYTLGLPANSLSGSDGESSVTLSTGAGSITLPGNMLAGLPGAGGKEIGITIGQGDKSSLPDDVRAAIGDRPLVRLTLTLDGQQAEWNNPAAPVTVSIPYTPTAEELLNPESIVIWYIDGGGNAVSVPNGRYDPATGTVTFSTTHFSQYAVGYNKVSFNDVAENAWYSKAVGFIAARGITSGTDGNNFSPDAKLTRGDFLVLLMRAYGIAPDENPQDNFADAGNTWYTDYLAAAKRLGISGGVGNNMFAPGKEITRQEMSTLLYNALRLIGELPRGGSGKTLSDFSDSGEIASWAKDAMTLLVETGTLGGSGGKLFPTGTTTRAEMAQVLYSLLSK